MGVAGVGRGEVLGSGRRGFREEGGKASRRLSPASAPGRRRHHRAAKAKVTALLAVHCQDRSPIAPPVSVLGCRSGQGNVQGSLREVRGPVLPRDSSDAVNGLGCNAVMRPVNLLIEAAAATVVVVVVAETGVGEGPQNSSVFYDTIQSLASTPSPSPCLSLCNLPVMVFYPAAPGN
ncbi:hypothetical protein E2C01_043275 [Portunus trituberculatus]|uniref:Uncharacterized protein n=1 Tax=Portunus trituberculatus TaxID=210409 RepID=A0A5B7FWV7_PORTR|nr:hypothetical protein [Portunus trituberculatus]